LKKDLIPLLPAFGRKKITKGEVFHLPFPVFRQAKGGGEGFYERFFKELKG
jgi:hypothetical protein